MKKQQTTPTEKKTEAPAQVKSAVREIVRQIGGSRAYQRNWTAKLTALCQAFNATRLELVPAAPRHYVPFEDDETI